MPSVRAQQFVFLFVTAVLVTLRGRSQKSVQVQKALATQLARLERPAKPAKPPPPPPPRKSRVPDAVALRAEPFKPARTPVIGREPTGYVALALTSDGSARENCMWATLHSSFPLQDSMWFKKQNLSLIIFLQQNLEKEKNQIVLERLIETLQLKSQHSDISDKEITTKLAQVMPKRLIQSLNRTDMSHEFTTPLGTAVIIQVIHIPLPRGVVENTQYPNSTDCCVCGGPDGPTPRIRGNMNFVAFNHFYVYQQFLSPWTRKFDYWFKIDYDVWFNPNPGKQIEFSMMKKMMKDEKYFMHGVVESCCAESFHPTIFEMAEAALLAGPDDATNARALIHLRKNKRNKCYYGNFVGGWLGFFQSPNVMDLMGYMVYHNDQAVRGLYGNRHGDQPLWDVPLRTFAPRNTILDMTKLWATQMYIHGKPKPMKSRHHTILVWGWLPKTPKAQAASKNMAHHCNGV